MKTLSKQQARAITGPTLFVSHHARSLSPVTWCPVSWKPLFFLFVLPPLTGEEIQSLLLHLEWKLNFSFFFFKPWLYWLFLLLYLNLMLTIKIFKNSTWLGSSVSWRIVSYTKRLQVWSLVGVRMGGSWLMFLSQINVLLSLLFLQNQENTSSGEG